MNDQAKNPAFNTSNGDVVQHFFRLMDDHQFDQLDSVLAPGLRFHIGSATMTRDETKAMIRGAYAAFPDLKHHVEEVLSIGDRVVARATDRATHLGEFQGVAATERRVSFGQIAIYHLVDNKIIEVWEQADVAGLMAQITAD